MPLTTPSHYIHNRQPVSGGTVKYWRKERFRFTPVDGSPYPDTAAADYAATTAADGSWTPGTLQAGDYYVSLEATGLVRSWTGDLIAPTPVAVTTCMPDGTEALPGLPFCADPDTGIWRDSSNHLAISSGGKLSWEISQGFGEWTYFDRGQTYERYLQIHSYPQVDQGGVSRYGVEFKSSGDFFMLDASDDIVFRNTGTNPDQASGWIYFPTTSGTLTAVPRFQNIFGNHIPIIVKEDTKEWWGYFGIFTGWQRIGAAASGGGSGGAPAGSGYQCHIYRNTNTGGIVNNTFTAVDFDTDLYDPDNMHDPVTNNSRITVPVDGTYDCWAGLQWATNATGRREGYFQVNGATVIGAWGEPAVSDGAVHRQGPSCRWRFSAGDYVEVFVRQTSGGNLILQTGLYWGNQFRVTQVSA